MFSVEIKIVVGGMSERIPEMKSIQGYSDGDKINSQKSILDNIIAKLQNQPEAHDPIEDPEELPSVLMATPQVCISGHVMLQESTRVFD